MQAVRVPITWFKMGTSACFPPSAPTASVSYLPTLELAGIIHTLLFPGVMLLLFLDLSPLITPQGCPARLLLLQWREPALRATALQWVRWEREPLSLRAPVSGTMLW